MLVSTDGSVGSRRVRQTLARASTCPPLEIHDLEHEIGKVGTDMFIALALANMRIYLVGGLALALIAILAIAMANHAEDRRTLALLRIRGASPRDLWRFVVATLLSPAMLGLVIGRSPHARGLRAGQLRLEASRDPDRRAAAADAPRAFAAHRRRAGAARGSADRGGLGVQLVCVSTHGARGCSDA